ncbi:hypothetical protein FRC09_001788 [Ceratobasidium sp. 395]|nr:hypothetical protein FRC09_001788 [Ceratobasidium sp. 395]
MALPADSLSRINRLNERLDKLRATSFRGDEDDDDELDRRHQSSEKRLLKVLRDACAFVREEITKNSPYLPEIVENVQILLDKGVEYAYRDSQLFDYLPSWAHDNTVISLTDFVPPAVGLFANFLQGLGLEDRSKDQLPPGPWKDTSWRHPKASRLARIRPRKFDLTSLGGHPLAKVIYDARCEIQSTSVPIPIDMYMSQGNTCLAVFGATGYKQRAPYLEYYLLEGSEANQDFPESYFVEPGSAEVAVHAALDESRRLIFLGDSRRVKSFAWAAPNGEAYEEPHPTHTLASNRVHGPLAVLPNGTVLRAGKGEVAVWNIHSLKTHGESGEQIIGKEDESIRENTWRDDPEEIEASSGSSPDSYIRFAGHPDWEIGRWKPLIQTQQKMAE